MYLAGTVSFLLSALVLTPVPMSSRPSRRRARMSCPFGCSTASSLSPAAIFFREWPPYPGRDTLSIPPHALPLALMLPLHAASYTTLALIRTPCPSFPPGLDTIGGGVLLGRPGPLPHPSETFRATITNERDSLASPVQRARRTGTS